MIDSKWIWYALDLSDTKNQEWDLSYGQYYDHSNKVVPSYDHEIEVDEPQIIWSSNKNDIYLIFYYFDKIIKNSNNNLRSFRKHHVFDLWIKYQFYKNKTQNDLKKSGVEFRHNIIKERLRNHFKLIKSYQDFINKLLFSYNTLKAFVIKDNITGFHIKFSLENTYWNLWSETRWLFKYVIPLHMENSTDQVITERSTFNYLKNYYLPFSRLHGDNIENKEQNNSYTLLKAYEKNIFRLLHVASNEKIIGSQINQYLLFITDSGDSETKNLFYQQLKHWMSLDIFKREFKDTYKAHTKIILPQLSKWSVYKIKQKIYNKELRKRLSIQGENKKEQNLIAMRSSKSIYKYEPYIIDSIPWNYDEEANVPIKKTATVSFSNHFTPMNLLKKIDHLCAFAKLAQLSKRNFIFVRDEKSVFFEWLIQELHAEIIASLKVMQTTESWIIHLKEVYQKLTFNLSTFINMMRYQNNRKNYLQKQSILNERINVYGYNNYSYKEIALKDNSFPSRYRYLDKIYGEQYGKLMYEVYIHPSENIELYLNWMEKNLKLYFYEMISKDLLHKNQLLQRKNHYEEQQWFSSKELNNLFHTKDFSYYINLIPVDNPKSKYAMDMVEHHGYIHRLRNIYLDVLYYHLIGYNSLFYHIEILHNVSKIIKDLVAKDHIRLVMSIAKNMNNGNVEIDDLLQEGMLGLTKAVERFQLDRGYQFTTYATWWVQQGLNRVMAHNSNHMIPIPTHLQRKIHLIQSTSRILGKKLKREPLVEEIAAQLKIPTYKIYQFLEASTLSRRLVSIDQKVAAGDNRTFQYFLRTLPQRVPTSVTGVFSYMFRFLSPRDATILQLRLGIVPYKRHTTEQVARIFSTHRDKIKIMEKIALQKIKHELSLYGRLKIIAPRLSKHLSDKILRST